MEPTICDPRLRTYNRPAICKSAADVYRHNPWRAPGTAPVFDPCGKAGGGNMGKPGPGAAFYVDSVNAKQGDLGSVVLPARPSGAVWHVGEEVETAWGMRANHGGGYQYRLCSKLKNLTEACFQELPLPFVGKQYLQYQNGTRQLINSSYAYANGAGIFTADGSVPTGYSWVMNPIPDGQQGDAPNTTKGVGTEFEPPCKDDTSGPTKGLCSGERPFHVTLIDIVKVPKTIPPGEYVLGWRWDVEETAQVWSACSDITIVK